MLGIDVLKETLACTLIDPETRDRKWYRVVPNSSSGWKQLLKLVPEKSPWVMEPTGRYSQLVAKLARRKPVEMCEWRSQKSSTFFRKARKIEQR